MNKKGNIKKEIISILDKKLKHKGFLYFLFGSRADGNNKYNSDYDIGILGKYKLPLRDYLSLKRELNDKINYRVDLVDFNRVSDDFKKIALKNIELWSK